ncbi:MAG: tRNA (adenosine(37)-N6)-dimethylallyltransferase MiaA [Planctomycetia bacterium]|nr:tRNA (adenosine(37)-N6)-dimethylallyltransferase MiaA [Planctomycetia bacterium]
MDGNEYSVCPRLVGCWYLTGPTASGKTRLGLDLARRLNAEIISLDSMAVYRQMDIGTAKPTAAERSEVRHHLLDLIEPGEEFSLASYMRLAREAAAEIRQRGREVLFVGGTPLYLKGVLRGIFDGPGADEAFRADMTRLEHVHGLGYLHQRLIELDPVTAARLHPNDLRRIIRALEVREKTGRPISFFQRQFDRIPTFDEAKVFVLDWNREQLYARINRRVDLMMEQGLLAEVRALLDRNLSLGRTASQAVGYRELISYLHGQISLDTAVDLIKQKTRNFAKSQGTWFRSLPECHFIAMNDERTTDNILDEIMSVTA